MVDLLTQFNELPEAAASAALLACCSSPLWADQMIAGRPFARPEDAIKLSAKIVSAMSVAALATALAGHPRIGAPRDAADRPDRSAHAQSAQWSRQEQVLVDAADAQTSRELAAANLEYERRFGHIYLVCASGRTGPELLALLRARLGNDADAEWQVVRSELQQINEIRLQRLLAGPA